MIAVALLGATNALGAATPGAAALVAPVRVSGTAISAPARVSETAIAAPPSASPVSAALPPLQPLPIDLDTTDLKPGQFLWLPEIAPSGPLVIVVSIPEQQASVYRNGVRIALSTVSTGKKGHETPTGVFTILQKHKDHKSDLYNSAPMPYMQRLTWDGVALHAGALPGYPASHGCVRLPLEFARRLFEVTTFGITVIVANDASAPAEVSHPGVFVPPIPKAGSVATREPRLSWFEQYRWRPEKSPDGPLTIIVSAADHRVLVMRNGIEIGRARFDLAGSGALGTQAYVLLAGKRDEASSVVPDRAALNWLKIALPGYTSDAASRVLDPRTTHRVTLPIKFSHAVYDALATGTTLLVTDAAVLPQTTGKALTVLTAGVPADEEGPPEE